jgi:hypothetical protein
MIGLISAMEEEILLFKERPTENTNIDLQHREEPG